MNAVELGRQTLLDYLPGASDGQIAAFWGITIRTVQRWRRAPHKSVTIWDADKYACHAGLSIADVWGPAVYREALVAA